MIIGKFDRNGRAFVNVGVYLPRLHTGGTFLIQVDTGADVTCVHPEASNALGIPFDQLDPATIRTADGVGGKSRYFVEAAVLVFVNYNDDREFEEVPVDLWIAESNEKNQSLESLLGTNVINAWRMNYDPPNGRLEFFP